MRNFALGLTVVALALEIRVAFVRVPRFANSQHAVHGAVHVHTSKSDGRGTLEAVARAAHADDLDFVVVTDHHVRSFSEPRVIEGVLMIPAIEESTAEGHVLAFGASRALSKAEQSDHPLAAIRALGGVAIPAHPLNRKQPFSGWSELDQAAGMEVLSLDDAWRDALHAPLANGLLAGFFDLANPRLAMTQLVRDPEATLARFDEARRTLDLALFCADDAHGWPSYAAGMGALSMYPDVANSSDAHAIINALETGHAFCALDAIAPAGGFHFAIETRTVRVVMPNVPQLASTTILFRDGVEISRSANSLELHAAPPGDYRVEVHARLPGAFTEGPEVPWILSNPIRLR